MEPTPAGAAAAQRFPRKLSESGLFQSVKGHVPQPALIPYTVNAPLWSDGAYKERYIALPGDDVARSSFTATRGWNFPDATVLVKSFALETEEGNPAPGAGSRRGSSPSRRASGSATPTSGTTRRPKRRWSTRRGADREFAIRVPTIPEASGRRPEADLALPQPGRVHGLPQPGRQLRPGPDHARR